MKMKFLLALLLLMFLATAAVSSDTPSSASKDTADQCDQQETIAAGIPSLDDQVEVNTETVVEKEVAAVCEVEIAVSLASHDDNVYFENYNANRNRARSTIISAEYAADNQRNIPLKWCTVSAAGRQST